MSKENQQGEASASQAHTQQKQDSSCSMSNKLRSPIPLRSAACRTQKLIPNNLGQIYENRSHRREQRGPPCLEGCGCNRLGWMNHGSDLGWRILILWNPLQKEFPLWTFPSAVAENENHLRLIIYVQWVGKMLVLLLRNSLRVPSLWTEECKSWDWVSLLSYSQKLNSKLHTLKTIFFMHL